MKPDDILLGKILIVDDQEANVILLEETLKAAGYQSVGSTRDPSRVCELHLLNHYDLILLDILMPGMDGFQVMENLKTLDPGGYLPVLVITAQSDHKMRALKAGARDFISKPFDLAEVLIRVHNMLEVRLLHQEAIHLCDRIQAEQEVSGRLLATLLPGPVVAALARRSMDAAGENLAEVTMLFADLLAFTAFSEGASADILKGMLDGVSAGGPRTLDETYLATSGLPEALANRTMAAAGKGMDLVAAMDRFNGHNPYKLTLRLGLGTGHS